MALRDISYAGIKKAIKFSSTLRRIKRPHAKTYSGSSEAARQYFSDTGSPFEGSIRAAGSQYSRCRLPYSTELKSSQFLDPIPQTNRLAPLHQESKTYPAKTTCGSTLSEKKDVLIDAREFSKSHAHRG